VLAAAFGDLFITQVTKDPVFFVSVVFTVVVSITLHELGHGIAAISQGDDTPRVTGHMTWDPLVHMGGLSLLMLAVAGLAWGMMPVDPTRFRGRYGEALVAAAGPAVNLLLALLSLTLLGLWHRFGGVAAEGGASNFQQFLGIFGLVNVTLFLLNLLPVPPLDGSTVLANFLPPYRRFVRNPDNQGIFLAAFFAVLLLAGPLFEAGNVVAIRWVAWIAGVSG
jgi:Zn-dependent protease